MSDARRKLILTNGLIRLEDDIEGGEKAVQEYLRARMHKSMRIPEGTRIVVCEESHYDELFDKQYLNGTA